MNISLDFPTVSLLIVGFFLAFFKFGGFAPYTLEIQPFEKPSL